jgi:hypothetical protein
VTGVMNVLLVPSNACTNNAQGLAVTGTIASNNLLTLRLPVGGGTATITAQLGTTLQSFTAASYTIDGGTCAMAATAGSISQFAPITGTYTGTLSETVPNIGTAINVTANLVQSTTPSADGQFPLSGSVTVTSPCATTFAFSDGEVTGNNVNGNVGLTNPPPPGILRGASIPTAASLQATLALYIPGCLNTDFNGSMTRQ